MILLLDETQTQVLLFLQRDRLRQCYSATAAVHLAATDSDYQQEKRCLRRC